MVTPVWEAQGLTGWQPYGLLQPELGIVLVAPLWLLLSLKLWLNYQLPRYHVDAAPPPSGPPHLPPAGLLGRTSH